MIRRPPRSTQSRSSAASDVYKRQDQNLLGSGGKPTSQRRSLHRSRIRRPITRRYHRDPDHGARTAFLRQTRRRQTRRSRRRLRPARHRRRFRRSKQPAIRYGCLWTVVTRSFFFVLARTHPLFFHSFNTIASLRGSGAERNRIVASQRTARVARTRDSTP